MIVVSRLSRPAARLLALAAAILALAACESGPDRAAPAAPTRVSAAAVSRTMVNRPSAQAPCALGGLNCDLRGRIAAADAYLATRPGVVGYVLRDRVTGGVYRNTNAGVPIWTASTIKLAMTADLLSRHRAGHIALTPQDYTHIDQMLHTSDDHAADALWFAYSGPNHLTYNNDFRAFGMTGLVPESGYTKYFPYWGFQKCTADDLDRLMSHVLGGLNPADRAYIVDRMRTVAPVQQWGVWGAGPAMRPGNKDGWSQEDTGWITNSVGFAGPNERYTLAIMDSLNGHGDFANGSTTVTHVAQLLLGGLG